MKDKDLKLLHKHLLEIFTEFERICKKHNLKYFSIAGTTLGAIRHNGFIPWDDDMDLAMPINDFLKFREIAAKELKEPFNFIDSFDKKNSKKFFFKIENVNTTFIEDSDKGFLKGIWIDIFPFSGVPNNNISLFFFLKRIYLCLAFDQYYNIEKNRCITLKQKFLKLLCVSLSFFRKKEFYLKKFENLMQKYDFYSSERVFYAWKSRFSYSIMKKYTVFDSSIFKTSIKHKFENVEISIPSGYNQYLTKCYGNYMELPKLESRRAHKPYILDFEKSYSEYVKEE